MLRPAPSRLWLGGPVGGPRLPYLQGAGVPVDQQTENRDLDAAGSCGQMEHSVHPGAWVSGGRETLLWGNPPGLRPPACGIFWANSRQEAFFSREAPSCRVTRDKDARPTPHSPVWSLRGFKRQVEHRVRGRANHVPKAGISPRPGQEAPLSTCQAIQVPQSTSVW